MAESLPICSWRGSTNIGKNVFQEDLEANIASRLLPSSSCVKEAYGGSQRSVLLQQCVTSVQQTDLDIALSGDVGTRADHCSDLCALGYEESV